MESGSPKALEDALALAYGQYLVDLSGSNFEWFINEQASEREYVLQGPLNVNVYFWRAAKNRLRTGGALTFAVLADLHKPLVDLTARMSMADPFAEPPMRKPWWAFWR